MTQDTVITIAMQAMFLALKVSLPFLAAGLVVGLAVSVFQAVTRRSTLVDSLVDALLDWRDPDTVPRPFGDESSGNRNAPLADVWELRSVRGFTDSLVGRLARFLTTRGSGAINVNAAPPEVLATVPGMTEEAIRIVRTAGVG